MFSSHLRAVAERDERHVACKEQGCWLFRDAHFLPRISGLRFRARLYTRTASRSRLCRFSYFYSRALRWNGRFHEVRFHPTLLAPLGESIPLGSRVISSFGIVIGMDIHETIGYLFFSRNYWR